MIGYIRPWKIQALDRGDHYESKSSISVEVDVLLLSGRTTQKSDC
jgi:hypothetical protein